MNALAENLKCYTVEERDKIATMLVERDLCYRNLVDTQNALKESGGQPAGYDSSSMVLAGIFTTLLVGFVGYEIGRSAQ